MCSVEAGILLSFCLHVVCHTHDFSCISQEQTLFDDPLQFLMFISTAGSDYNVADVRRVTFRPGVTEAFYEIPIVNDHEHEPSETFTASLSTADPNVNIVDGNGTITITDDDEAGKFSIPTVSGTVKPHILVTLGSGCYREVAYSIQDNFNQCMLGVHFSEVTTE